MQLGVVVPNKKLILRAGSINSLSDFFMTGLDCVHQVWYESIVKRH